MPNTKIKKQKGVTLIELMMAILISTIVIFGVAIMLVDNLKGWNTMYSRLHSDAAEQSYEVRRVFDRVVRQASINNKVLIDPAGTFFVVHYFDYLNSPLRKCQAVFSYSDTTTTLTIICRKDSDNDGKTFETTLENWTIPNMIACHFKQSGEFGRAIQMLLTLDNTVGNQQQTFDIYACAYLNSL